MAGLKTNHYETLNVHKSADQETIRRSYKILAKQHHPDRNASSVSAKKMSQINVAYKVLSNPEKRREYDALQSLINKYRFEIPEEEFTRNYNCTSIKGKVNKKYAYILKLKKFFLWFLKKWSDGSIYVFIGIVYPLYLAYKLIKFIYFIFSEKEFSLLKYMLSKRCESLKAKRQSNTE